jgi:hypothetical protein
VHIKQLRVGQHGPDRGDSGWPACRQLGLFAGEGAHGLAWRIGRHRGVHLGDALVIVDGLVIPGLLRLAVVGSRGVGGATPFST